MSAKQKFETIEAAAEAMGVEINEKTKVFLEAFVKKEAKGASSTEKKKALFETAALYGVEVDAEKENTQSLIIKIATHLFAEGMTDELSSFCNEQNIVVVEGQVYHKKQGVKPIAERNSGQKEGTVGYNTIQLLKDPELVDKTPAELVVILQERYEQTTTPQSISWYINYCKQKGIEICDRKRAARAAKVEGGAVLGAPMTLEKAYAPKGFSKKKDEAAAPAATVDPETLDVN